MARTRPGRLFVALMVAWLLVPLLRDPRDAQDAVPLVVAGELVEIDPASVYVPKGGGLFDLAPAFRERSCEILAESLDCESFAVAFVSPPAALPFARVLALLGPTPGILFVRLLVAAAMVTGMVVLWSRLASGEAWSAWMLLAVAVLTTPLTLIVTGHGQTSAFMFTAAALAPSEWDRRGGRRVLLVSALVGAIVFKASPALVLLVSLLHKRWRTLGATLVLVLAATVAGVSLAGGFEIFSHYLVGSAAVASEAPVNPYSGSVDAFLHKIAGSPSDVDATLVRATAVRAGLLALMMWALWRARDEDARWAVAWSAVPLLAPLAWWHYSGATVAGMGTLLGARQDRRLWVAWAVMLTAGLPFGVANNRGYSYPEAQFLWALAAFLVVCFFACCRSGSELGRKSPPSWKAPDSNDASPPSRPTRT